MIPHLRRAVHLVLLCATASLAGPLRAQEGTEPDSGSDTSAGRKAPAALTVADLEAELAAIDSDSNLEGAVKAAVQESYKQAIELVKAAQSNAALADGYRAALKTAPPETTKLVAQLEALPTVEKAAQVDPGQSLEQLQQEVASRRTALADIKSKAAGVNGDITRVRARPVEISDRQSKARVELADVETQLASPDMVDATSLGRKAGHTELQARQMALASELQMLEQEQLSATVREKLFVARSNLLTRQIENAEAAFKTFEALVNERLMTDAQRLAALADKALQGPQGGEKTVQTLANDVKTLAKEFEEVVSERKKAKASRASVSDAVDVLTRDYDTIQAQAELGGLEGVMGPILLEQQRNLPSLRAYSLVFKTRQVTMSSSRLAAHRLEKRLRERKKAAKDSRIEPSAVVRPLTSARIEVLEKLSAQHRALVSDLALLDVDERRYLDKVGEFREFLREKRFWARSSPPISVETLTAVPDSIRWLFSGEHISELWSAVKRRFTRAPITSIAGILLVVVLLATRRSLRAVIDSSSSAIRRIKTDQYAHTTKAFLATVLVALPLPLLIGIAGTLLKRDPNPSQWLREMADVLNFGAPLLFGLLLLVVVCRPGGLGAAHFGWDQASLVQIRRGTLWFTVAYVPAALVTSSTFYDDSSLHFDSLGRLVFCLAHVWTSFVLWRMLRPADGIFTQLFRDEPKRLVSRSRNIWYPLLVTSPLVLVVPACLGYLTTAVLLSFEFVTTLGLIAAGIVAYGLILRWFTIRERRLAFAEALERRRARQQASEESAATTQEAPDETVAIEVEEEELDLASVEQQTHQLLRFVVGVAVAISVWLLWWQTVPALRVLDSVNVVSDLSILELAKAALIGTITYIGARNLPGLLEVAVLRAMDIEVGTRNAITTLCQYALVAIGLGLLSSALNLDWTKFGWIAAALSVGIGFGLQEVVANFICGIILLFERPVRVGDIVTLSDVTGTVTKIRMRATTITNWDRKEFVVPNRDFITGTILNWTLTNPINRIVINVGVAYGSDTPTARQLLLDVANDHPLILEDPAPMATFEQFGDSSLALLLRCYLPNLDNRITTITELHTEIDRRFKEAGIEIAFPQQDLHLRSVDPSIDFLPGDSAGSDSAGSD